jgi:CheY-like chemotaxis protein
MTLIRLIHWNLAEAEQRAARLSAAGYEALFALPNGRELLRELKATQPAAVVIDLGRLPSQGRDMAVLIRSQVATRRIPLVFAGGEADKVARVQEIIPDAVYTSWSRIRSALKHAIAHPPAEPVRPASVFAGYSGQPLTKKLGIKPGMTVGIIAAPEGFMETVGVLPPGARLRAGARRPYGLLIWFVRSQKELARGIDRTARLAADVPLWIAWPKKTSALAADVSETAVRQMGLNAGLVDYKICAIDATWSGLLFRKRARPPAQ